MKDLSKYLVEQILLEGDTPIKNIVVVYSGRFQPFHKGHNITYQHLVKKFGKNNVYIGTSNKMDAAKSPFSFKEKKKIMETMFGIPSSNIVQIKNPYAPTEILKKYDEETTAYVTAVGEKDASRLGGKYFQKYDDNPSVGYRDKGYVYISPKQSNAVSGTEVRNGLGNGTDQEKMDFFTKRAYPKFNKSIFDLVTKKLNESFVIEKETIEEWLLKESTVNVSQVNSADDGPTFMYPNFSVYSKISAKRAKKIGYTVVDMIMTKELEDYYEHPTYPHGPANAVSYYPAGVMGAKTPNNQIEIYGNGAYTKWYKHVTRKATLSGYELIFTQLQRAAQKREKKMATADAKGDKKFKNMKNPNAAVTEAITLPIEIGDTLLMGKFKNKKVVVKTIGKDDHGVPTINGKKVFTFRYGQKAPNIFNKEVVFEEDVDLELQFESVLTHFKNLGIPRTKMPQIHEKDLDKFRKYLDSLKVKYTNQKISLEDLKFTQKELSLDKVKKFKKGVFDDKKLIVVSKDGYILDGHHRVLAKYMYKLGDTINAIRVSLPIKKLLTVAHNFSEVDYKDNVHEMVSINEASDKLKLKIPSDIQKIHKGFKKSGKKLYVVGGAVRDAILGKSPKDFDLATDAKPDETLDIAKKMGFNTAEVGKAFGVVIVGGHEIATFRKDIGKGRRPDAVDYTDIEGDVKRRDLTINALFYDMDRNEIVDLVGGIEDLKNKKIRTVGKASDRFDEDPLRKLRALRFQTKLGGKMDTDLLIALKQDPSLKGVSSERIRDEFVKSINSSKYPSKYMEMLDKIGFTKLILPSLKISKPYINDNDHILFLSYLLRNNDVSNLSNTLNKLNYTSAEIKNITFLVSLQHFKPEEIVLYKKKQTNSGSTDAQIKSFGKLISKDFSKFLKFNLSVKGNEVPSDVKGPEIGKWISNAEKKKFLGEMAKTDLGRIEKYADAQLSPEDIQFTKHFFDRVNDPRNTKEISVAELTGFFKRLSKFKKQFKEFLTKYNEIVVKDNRSNINIPFVKNANKVIAKTVMRKKDFRTSNPVLSFESINEASITATTLISKLDDELLWNGSKTKASEVKDFVKQYVNGSTYVVDAISAIYTLYLKKKRTKNDITGFIKDLASSFKFKFHEEVATDQSRIKAKIQILTKKLQKPDITSTEHAMLNKEIDTLRQRLVTQDSISELVHDIDESLESIILEGGAYGHMNHPFDTEINLTFGQLKDIVKRALNGDLELTREKTDGQALAISWKKGKLVAARNKGHLKNRGENALDIKGMATKFKGRGELEKAYNFAMQDLSKAIKALSDKQRDKIFQDGASFMNLEVIYPTSVNVIPYGQAMLIFHGTMQYNEDGVAIGENQGAGGALAGMIKQINQNIQSKYSIQGPPVIKLPKSQDLSKHQSKYNAQISKLQKEFGLKDSDGVAEYHQAWWKNWITKNSPTKLDKSTIESLIKRWAFNNKSFRLDKKSIPDEKTLEWAKNHEKIDNKNIAKQNMMKFENIFLGVGAEVLQFTSSVLTVNPDKAIRAMKKRLDQTIKDVNKGGDEKQIAKLKLELERLNSIGGPDKIVPNEGIVFVYNGNTFKLTGAFASLNQLLGIFY